MNYLCPYCNGYISINDNVVFSVRGKDGTMGLLLLHPELGNYTMSKHPDFKYVEGEILDFFCPICHKNLTSYAQDNLVKVIFEDDKEHLFEIHFSKIAGEKSTYKTIGENVEIFGEHSNKYIDFVTLSLLK